MTSLDTKKVPPGRLYTEKYCPHGNMENNIKEQKLDVKSDRTSTHTFAGNQLRLWFSSIAYILMNALREECLAKTELKNATVGTIRTKLLKLGAIITFNSQRVLIAITCACPYKDIFATEERLFISASAICLRKGASDESEVIFFSRPYIRQGYKDALIIMFLASLDAPLILI